MTKQLGTKMIIVMSQQQAKNSARGENHGSGPAPHCCIMRAVPYGSKV